MTEFFTTLKERAELANDLRQLADIVELFPEIPIPTYRTFSITEYLYGDEDPKEVISNVVRNKVLRRRLADGKWEKKYNNGTFSAKAQVGTTGKVTVELSTARENVCEAKVVGKRMVERPQIDLAPKILVEEDIIEWDCNDSALLPTTGTE